MSFYSYKNANPRSCPGLISGDAMTGLTERVCVQVKRVYDSGLIQEQLDNKDIVITNYAVVPSCNCGCGCGCGKNCGCGCHELPEPCPPVAPIVFESCRSSSTQGTICNLSIERLCDRPCYARVRANIDVPIDILFSDSRCIQYVGQGVVRLPVDVLLSIPDEAIVPYCIESMVSAICVSGTYCGDNVFRLTICITAALKVIAEVEMLVPSYGFCTIPPSEEFAENVCDEFFALPLYPPALCNEETVGCGRACGCGCGCGCVGGFNTQQVNISPCHPGSCPPPSWGCK